MRAVLRLALALALLGAGAALAQEADEPLDDANAAEAPDVKTVRLLLDDVTTQVEPRAEVQLYFRALSALGLPIRGLKVADFEVWQEKQRIPDKLLELAALRASGARIGAVVALDASGSMKGDAFANAKAASLALLEQMDPEDQIAVVTFADEVDTVVSFGDPREQARKALRELEIDRAKAQHTHLFDGIHRAVQLIREAPTLPRRTFVVVLTDGEDEGSERTEEQVVKLANGVEDEPPVLLFAIGYVGRTREESMRALQQLAVRAGGDFMRADSAAHLQDFFDAIANQVLSSYVIRFPGDFDGARHTLRLNFRGQSATRDVKYPDLRSSLWPMLGALLGAAALAGLGALLFRLRSNASAGRLEVVNGANAGAVVTLRAGKTRLGASEDNDLIVTDTTVSRYHAEIRVEGRRIEIEDLHSTNGTFVNGGPVSRRQQIRPGDRIALADVELRFER
jgi:VWFA-related protein